MKKELLLLHNRLKKIDERNFDLTSWKKGTIAVLDTILGSDNLKRKLIEEIEFENNSWSLRDTTGDVDSIKRMCADVLETIILEIETLGLAEPTISKSLDEELSELDMIEKAVKKELSQSQYDELIDLVRGDNTAFVDVVDKIKRYGYEVAPRILASLLMSQGSKKR